MLLALSNMIRADGTQKAVASRYPRNEFRGYKMSHAYGIQIQYFKAFKDEHHQSRYLNHLHPNSSAVGTAPYSNPGISHWDAFGVFRG